MEPKFDEMSPAERILHVQDLWDRIAEKPDSVPFSDEWQAEVERRLEEYRADPSIGVPWEQVKQRIRTRR